MWALCSILVLWSGGIVRSRWSIRNIIKSWTDMCIYPSIWHQMDRNISTSWSGLIIMCRPLSDIRWSWTFHSSLCTFSLEHSLALHYTHYHHRWKHNTIDTKAHACTVFHQNYIYLRTYIPIYLYIHVHMCGIRCVHLWVFFDRYEWVSMCCHLAKVGLWFVTWADVCVWEFGMASIGCGFFLLYSNIISWCLCWNEYM